jgi:hypothetical protein
MREWSAPVFDHTLLQIQSLTYFSSAGTLNRPVEGGLSKKKLEDVQQHADAALLHLRTTALARRAVHHAAFQSSLG